MKSRVRQAQPNDRWNDDIEMKKGWIGFLHKHKSGVLDNMDFEEAKRRDPGLLEIGKRTLETRFALLRQLTGGAISTPADIASVVNAYEKKKKGIPLEPGELDFDQIMQLQMEKQRKRKERGNAT